MDLFTMRAAAENGSIIFCFLISSLVEGLIIIIIKISTIIKPMKPSLD